MSLALTSLAPSFAGDEVDGDQASGWTTKQVSGEGYSFDISRAENLQMARQLARDYDTSVSEAIEQYAWQLDFIDFVDMLRERASDSFVSAEILSYKSTPRAWIAFSRTPPVWIDGAIRDLGIPLEVRYKEGVLTEREQERLVPEVHYALSSTPGISVESTSIDPLTSEVRVLFYVESEQRTAAILSLAERAVSLRDSDSHFSVVLLESETTRSVLDSNVRGGGQLRKQSGETGCTSGFAATRAGENGVLTAKHCTGSAYAYYSVINGSTYNLTGAHTTSHDRGDIRWKKTTTSITNFVHNHKTNHSSGVRVNQTKGSVVGQNVVLFGRTSGYKEDKVYRLNVCGAADYCNLTAVTNFVSANGDSGGPWRTGTAAVGIHHGRANVDNKLRSMYTRIGVANTDLGVVVRTTP
ncbi:MAG: hypothetical protein GX593_14375 [Actinomycetales bacterium]|nr:hypothetical protein [Actinomycetales bacterium]